MVEPLARKERQELLAFGGFIVLGLTIVGVVLVVQNGWDERRWAAVAALGTWAQTAAVTSAVVYAARQLRVSRDSERRQLRARFADRLEELALGELEPMVAEIRSNLQSLHADLSVRDKFIERDQQDDLQNWRTASVPRFKSEAFQTRLLVDRTHSVVMRLFENSRAVEGSGAVFPRSIQLLGLVLYGYSLVPSDDLGEARAADFTGALSRLEATWGGVRVGIIERIGASLTEE